MKFNVIGAGMAGLLAANILREKCGAVFEAQSSLPNNHSAVLRFRSSVVGDAVNIPFREVSMMKAVHPWRNPVADAIAYSRKATGKASVRSITSATGEVSRRFIAPEDFIARMADALGNIVFDKPFHKMAAHDGPIISTIPMPTLMEILGWPEDQRPVFEYRNGNNLTARIEGADIFASIYCPDPFLPFSRVSITGDRLIAEQVPNNLVDSPEQVAATALEILGFTYPQLRPSEAKITKQKYAKILPIDEGIRRRFIMWASDQFGIYSLGRFATWRPGLLLDDAVNDVRVIQRIALGGGSTYSHRTKG